MFFFFNDTATTEIYTLSLHDALPIYSSTTSGGSVPATSTPQPPDSLLHSTAPSPERVTFTGAGSGRSTSAGSPTPRASRSEEHTSELQSRQYLVCRLLLEKKKIRTLK